MRGPTFKEIEHFLGRGRRAFSESMRRLEFPLLKAAIGRLAEQRKTAG